MLKKHVIYPGFGLDMRNFGYVLSFYWIKKDEVFRTMKTFANFNVVTALAFIKGDRHVLHLQYPKDKEIEIFQILDELESGNQVFKVLRVHNNRVLPHTHYFEKERRRKE